MPFERLDTFVLYFARAHEYSNSGVVHRDLKPENLLLDNLSESAILKIADFGFSAVIFAAESSDMLLSDQYLSHHSIPHIRKSKDEHSNVSDYTPLAPPQLRRLKSVVGSPYHMAPEIGIDGKRKFLS